MKSTILSLMTAFGLVMTVFSPVYAEEKMAETAAMTAVVGKPAPDFTAKDTNGKDVKLSDLKGKIVVLEWTNHECPFVQKHYSGGNMQALQKEATDKGVTWLSIVSSAPGKQGHLSAEDANKVHRSGQSLPNCQNYG